MRATDTVIVGAGISGLTAARTLAQAGRQVVVFDKGRGPGGRATSRRRDGFTFDHGAQYFTARTEPFRQAVGTWVRDGVVAPWNPRLVAIDARGSREVGHATERYVGTPHMSALAKHLAHDLDVRCEVLVDDIVREGTGWRVLDASGGCVAEAPVVLVTAA
jgi:predicted NAD/FAD-dependent oxidoreductase